MADETHETQETTVPADASNIQQQSKAVEAKGAPGDAGAPSVSENASEDAKIRNDIAQILEQSKLPERRASDLSGEKQRGAPVADIDTLLGHTDGKTASEAAPAVPQADPAPAPKKDSLQSVHTFKQDLQDVVRDQKISVVKAAALEQEKTRAPEFVTPAHGNGVKNFLFIAFALVFLGAAALGGVYLVVQNRSTNPTAEQTNGALVFSEQSVVLPLEGQTPVQLKELLAEARTTAQASLGSITRIIPTVKNTTGEGERAASTREFLAAIGVQPGETLLRALGDEFFFGLHTVDKNAPVLVIPVLAYDRAFAGMLDWESMINADLSPIYMRIPDVAPGEDGIPRRRQFEDVVMRNYDVRALIGESGEIALYYAFPTRDMLLIAESPYSFTELLSRLQVGTAI